MNPAMNSVGVTLFGGYWRVLYVVLLGQLASFSLALTTFCASLTAHLGVNAPFALAFSSALPLTLVYGTIFLYGSQKLHISWYWYVLLAIVAVHGSYLVNKAFQFSSITSVTILECWTVVWVIILTRLFLGTKYSLWQFVGAALCVSGLCLVLISDSGVGGGGGSNPVLGDALVIGGTCFLAMKNVGEEFCVKKVGRVEVIAMSGLFATPLILIEIHGASGLAFGFVFQILTFAGFGISSFMLHSLTPIVLQASGSTLFSLSLLTTVLWAVVIRVFLYHQKVSWLCYVSFLFVSIGLLVYSKTEKYSNEIPELENDDPDQLYQFLPEEVVRV